MYWKIQCDVTKIGEQRGGGVFGGGKNWQPLKLAQRNNSCIAFEQRYAVIYWPLYQIWRHAVSSTFRYDLFSSLFLPFLAQPGPRLCGDTFDCENHQKSRKEQSHRLISGMFDGECDTWR